jgi:lipopolysaccharide/colanic/teichoic acid biosynthesis glycosyltransferase
MRRFAMYPGLTGLWQVNGRSLLPDKDRIRLDLTYVDNWSVWLDVKVLARTLPVVLTGRGAC